MAEPTTEQQAIEICLRGDVNTLTVERDYAQAKLETAESLNTRYVEQLKPLKSLAQWLVALDEPGSTERRTVTLTAIINQAREALAPDAGTEDT